MVLTLLKDEMENQETSGSVPSTVRSDSKNRKKTCQLDSSKTPKHQHIFFNDSASLTSNVMPPVLKPAWKLRLHRNDTLKFQLCTEKIQN